MSQLVSNKKQDLIKRENANRYATADVKGLPRPPINNPDNPLVGLDSGCGLCFRGACLCQFFQSAATNPTS